MSNFAKERQDYRMKDYKSSFNADLFKKKREDVIISVRKQKTEENIMKRRNFNIPEIEQSEQNEIIQKLHILPDFIRDIQSHDTNTQINGTIGLRKLLSIQVNPPIDEVIATGIISRLVEFLGRSDCPKLQFEAAWALTNVASGNTEQTYSLINAGAIPAFVNQLQSPEISVREQAVWALGNIAGDSYQCRDRLLQHQVLLRLLPHTANHVKPSLRRNAVWTISNLCRGKPSPPFSYVSPAIPYLAELIACPDTQIVTDSCWALSYISDGDNYRIQAVIDAGVCERIVMNLTHQSILVQTPALRVIGNIVTGDDVQTQTIIDHHVLPRLKHMLDNPEIRKQVKKEVCWTISNITAGTPNQIQAVIEVNLFESLIFHLIYSDFEIRKEAAWAIANATSSGTPEHIKHLVSKGCIKPLCILLEINDPRIVAVALEALENILEKGDFEDDDDDNNNPYALIIEDCGAIPVIENLQLHANQALADKATSVIQRYFSSNSADEFSTDEDIAPAPNQDSFSFGQSSSSNNFTFNFQ